MLYKINGISNSNEIKPRTFIIDFLDKYKFRTQCIIEILKYKEQTIL